MKSADSWTRTLILCRRRFEKLCTKARLRNSGARDKLFLSPVVQQGRQMAFEVTRSVGMKEEPCEPNWFSYLARIGTPHFVHKLSLGVKQLQPLEQKKLRGS